MAPKDPLQGPSDAQAEEDARAAARLITHYPVASKIIGALLLLGLLTLGPDLAKASLRSVGLLPSWASIGDAHDAGAGPAAQRQALHQAISEELASLREQDRNWMMQQLQASEARTNSRIDQVLLLAKLRGGLAGLPPLATPQP